MTRAKSSTISLSSTPLGPRAPGSDPPCAGSSTTTARGEAVGAVDGAAEGPAGPCCAVGGDACGHSDSVAAAKISSIVAGKTRRTWLRIPELPDRMTAATASRSRLRTTPSGDKLLRSSTSGLRGRSAQLPDAIVPDLLIFVEGRL